MYNFNRISKSDLTGVNTYNILLEHNSADEYWLLYINDKSYGFFVDSTIMIPPVVELFAETEILIIGIHDFIAAFSTITGKIEFLSGLSEPISLIEKVYLGYLIITDTQISFLNQYFFSITKVISIPDIISNYEFIGNKIRVTGLSNEVFETFW